MSEMARTKKNYWTPASASTKVLHPAIWRVSDLSNLLLELHALDLYHARTGRQLLYRGQRDASWQVHSTYARFSQSCGKFGSSDGDDFHFRAIEHFLDFHTRQCEIKTEFQRDCDSDGLDYLFEVHCRIQQDPGQFDPRIAEIGTLITDWTVDPRIGLFFSIWGRDEKDTSTASIFIYDPFALNFVSTKTTLLDELREDLRYRRISSDCVVICPERQISYLRKQVQKARYISQQNLNMSLDSLWNLVLEQHDQPNQQFHLKLEIPASVVQPLGNWLSNQDFEERRLFPDQSSHCAGRHKINSTKPTGSQ